MNRIVHLWTIILFTTVFLGIACCEEYDFQTYEVFKSESTRQSDNSECTCTKNSNETGYEWGKWSSCQRHSTAYKCHQGLKHRSRSCSDGPRWSSCSEREWKYCYHESSCAGQWQQWSESLYGGECSHSCGGGVRIKVRVCTLNKEVGLFCKGIYRSPYDLKKEACNTHRCPAWSDWTVVAIDCSSASSGGIITTRRDCVSSPPTQSHCKIGQNDTKHIDASICSPHDTGDRGPTTDSAKQDPLANDITNSDYQLNVLSHILLIIIVLLTMALITTLLYACSKKHGLTLNDLRKHAGTIYISKRARKFDIKKERDSLKDQEQYGEFEIIPQLVNNTFVDRMNEKNHKNLPANSCGDSTFSGDGASTTYTTMSGSSFESNESVKSVRGDSDSHLMATQRSQNQEHSVQRTPDLPSRTRQQFIDEERLRQQPGLRGSIENLFRGLKVQKRPARGSNANPTKTQDIDKDMQEDLDTDYTIMPQRSSSFLDNDLHVGDRKSRTSQRSRHLYAEIHEVEPKDVPLHVHYAQVKPKRTLPFVA